MFMLVLTKKNEEPSQPNHSNISSNLDCNTPLETTQIMAAVATQQEQQQQEVLSSSEPEGVTSAEDEDDLLEDDVTRWDEGGRSDCGYGDGVHDALMSMGSAIHKIVGEPSEQVVQAMNQIGNWFQEASYAARDLKQGNMNVGEETMQAVKSVVSGEPEDDEEKMNPPATAEEVTDEKKESS